MSRAPTLTVKVVDSIETLLAGLPLVDFLDDSKEAGIVYLTALVKHYHSPSKAAERRRNIQRTRDYEKGLT